MLQSQLATPRDLLPDRETPSGSRSSNVRRRVAGRNQRQQASFSNTVQLTDGDVRARIVCLHLAHAVISLSRASKYSEPQVDEQPNFNLRGQGRHEALQS
jgi:hypothetical protein